MRTVQRNRLKANPIVAKIVLATSVLFVSSAVHANAGFGVNTDISGNTIAVPTYYANSPQGLQPALDPVTHLPCAACGSVDTGTALRKFVDPFSGVGIPKGPGFSGAGGVAATGAVPMAFPQHNWVNPLTGQTTHDDYYEIAIVAYTEQMHSDLAKPTSLRGYVQIATPSAIASATAAALATGQVYGGPYALNYPDGTAVKDIKGAAVFTVYPPHYMGPIIVVQRGTAIRMKYTNYLPYNDINGNPVGSSNGGELPIPVDTFIAGGGPAVDKNGNPLQFSQNRANIHWHGGDTPWISDGTPHQWTAPAGEAVAYSAGIGKGASTKNVPDMEDPGDGSTTLYFPNNISARLMFYHDHTSALTRLNVYEGLAAPYVVQDKVEQDLVKQGVIPNTLGGVGVPLVIQDKTFVPKNIGPNDPINNPNYQGQSQDAKWNLAHWGAPGDLWFPHVYETNQDPNSIDATNPVGRWDWGPWFWPVFPSQYSLPSGNYGDVTTTPEAFMDTPVVNGQAYPTMTVDPVPTRFRLLHVPNDRSGNYNFYEAVDAKGVVCDAVANPAPAAATPGPGQSGALAACTEVRMVPAASSSYAALTPSLQAMTATWPTDGRVGGVPDPTTAGPDIVQIGNEAGLLPAPAVWHPQPVTYDQNVRSMTIFNVLNHGLLMGGAERADLIVDFSKYAGKTLILYNDAPAPMPGFDPRIDYFSNQGDQSIGGGSYNTLPGYGPNTRTVMQIVVNSTITGAAINSISAAGSAITAFNMPALKAALPVAYAASQPAPNVPETAYNAAFGTNNTDNYTRIFTGSNTQPEFSFSAPGYMVAAGSGAAIVNTTGTNYTSVPTVVINGQLPTVVTTSVDPLNGATIGTNGPAVGATAHAVLSGGTTGTLTGIVVDTVGAGYLTKPTIVISGGGATVQATATLSSFPTQIVSTVHVINKAIQELFDPVYGRMNATLAVELPYSSSQIATTIPLAYVDAPIESMDAIKDGETQIWKITHNGVDSHPVHFHLVNVQVINRVDWAGVVKPPEANEIGWKEVLRMNPLEDVYVAVRAVHPVVPFGLPRSQRTLDPSQAVGSQTGFTQIDQMTGNAPVYQTQLVNGISTRVATTAYSNQLTDFDNEYVWHCHILGHEENDFMRPFIFHPDVVVPDEPGNVVVNGSTVTWTDPTPFGGQDSAGVPTAGINAGYVTPTSSTKNEVGFRVQQTISTAVSTSTPIMQNTWAISSPTATVTRGGRGYVAASTTVIINGTLKSGTAPTATAIVSGGVVTGVTISNYLTAVYSTLPTITFISDTATQGARATLATISLPPVVNGYNKANTVTTGVTNAKSVPANTTSWTDTAGMLAAPGANNTAVVLSSSTKIDAVTLNQIQTVVTANPVMVIAYNAAGDSVHAAKLSAATDGTTATAASATLTAAATALINTAAGTSAVAGPSAPTGLTQTVDAAGNVTISWAAVPGATGYLVTYGNPATVATILPVVVTPATLTTPAVTTLATTFTIPAAQANGNASVVAIMANGTQVLQSAASAGLYNGVALAPVGFTANPSTAVGAVTLTWANNPINVNNVTGFTLSWTGATTGSAIFGTPAAPAPASKGATVTGLTSGGTYTFSLIANGSAGNSAVITPLYPVVGGVAGTSVTAP